MIEVSFTAARRNMEHWHAAPGIVVRYADSTDIMSDALMRTLRLLLRAVARLLSPGPMAYLNRMVSSGASS